MDFLGHLTSVSFGVLATEIAMGTVPIAFSVVKTPKDTLFNVLDFGGLSVSQAVGVAVDYWLPINQLVLPSITNVESTHETTTTSHSINHRG